MRTTLTLDDDVADRLKQLAQREGKPFRHVLNEVLRRGLSGQRARRRSTRFSVEPFDSAFRAGVDPNKLNQLVDELDAAPR